MEPRDIRCVHAEGAGCYGHNGADDAAFDAVLLDAPCSNTGVMRHRVDVKWRLQEGDIARHAAQQFELLRAEGARGRERRHTRPA